MSAPEFTLDKIRAFSAMGHRSVAARMVRCLLTEYDNQLDEFLQFLVKEGYCDVDVYHQETTAIDQFLNKKRK
jgi:hypothetical protein